MSYDNVFCSQPDSAKSFIFDRRVCVSLNTIKISTKFYKNIDNDRFFVYNRKVHTLS